MKLLSRPDNRTKWYTQAVLRKLSLCNYFVDIGRKSKNHVELMGAAAGYVRWRGYYYYDFLYEGWTKYELDR